MKTQHEIAESDKMFQALYDSVLGVLREKTKNHSEAALLSPETNAQIIADVARQAVDVIWHLDLLTQTAIGRDLLKQVLARLGDSDEKETIIG